MAWRQMLRSLTAGPDTQPVVASAADDPETARLAARLKAAAFQRLGHGLSIRMVDSGSCNGCEQESRMLSSTVHDLEHYGLRFVTSPRHADILMVTGPVTRNMQDALVRTWQATPDPKFVIALGDCAIDGGVFKGSPAILGGIDSAIPVDLIIRGCPPTPSAIIAKLCALLEASH